MSGGPSSSSFFDELHAWFEMRYPGIVQVTQIDENEYEYKPRSKNFFVRLDRSDGETSHIFLFPTDQVDHLVYSIDRNGVSVQCTQIPRNYPVGFPVRGWLQCQAEDRFISFPMSRMFLAYDTQTGYGLGCYTSFYPNVLAVLRTLLHLEFAFPDEIIDDGEDHEDSEKSLRLTPPLQDDVPTPPVTDDETDSE